MFSTKFSIVCSTICASFAMAVLPQFASAQTTISLQNTTFTLKSSYSSVGGNASDYYADGWGFNYTTYHAPDNSVDPTVRVVSGPGGNFAKLGSSNFASMGQAGSTDTKSLIYQNTGASYVAGTYTLTFTTANLGNAGSLYVNFYSYNPTTFAPITLSVNSQTYDESALGVGGTANQTITFTLTSSDADVIAGNKLGLSFSHVGAISNNFAYVGNVNLVGPNNSVVPEPGTYAMLAGMVITSGGMLVRRRRNK